MFEQSFHFIPGNKSQWIESSGSFGADALIFDLEDAISSKEKSAAVEILSQKLQFIEGKALKFVRVNGIVSSVLDKENNLLSAYADIGIVFPKVENIEHLEFLFKCYPQARDRKLIYLIENFIGLANCRHMVSFHRPYGIALGLEDFLSETFFQKKDLNKLVQYIRCKLALIGGASGCRVIDTVSLDTKGGAEFQADCEEARSCGMTSKFTIHPLQIPKVKEAFSPEKDIIQNAVELSKHFEGKKDLGYLRYKDKVISPPTLTKANFIRKYYENYVNK